MLAMCLIIAVRTFTLLTHAHACFSCSLQWSTDATRSVATLQHALTASI
jgi:hypothetical protein